MSDYGKPCKICKREWCSDQYVSCMSCCQPGIHAYELEAEAWKDSEVSRAVNAVLEEMKAAMGYSPGTDARMVDPRDTENDPYEESPGHWDYVAGIVTARIREEYRLTDTP